MSNPIKNHTNNPYDLVTPYTNARRQLNEEKETSNQSITSATNAIASLRITTLQQEIPNGTRAITRGRVSSLQPQVPGGTNAIASLEVSTSQLPIIPLTFVRDSNVKGPDAKASENVRSPTYYSSPNQNFSAQQSNQRTIAKPKSSNLFGLPNEILETIIKSSGLKVKEFELVNKQFKNLADRVIESFWLENFENPEILNANPVIRNYINKLRASVGSDRWNALNPVEKLNQLYRKMIDQAKKIDPMRVRRLQIQDQIFDFSLYQQLPRISDINFGYLQRAIAARLPEITTFSPSQLRNFMCSKSNIANIRWVAIDDMDMTALPPEIELLTNVQVLSVQRTNLTALPDQLSMPRLQTLHLSGTQIKTLPINIDLPNLLELDLSHTPISTWPNNVPLQNLQALGLSQTTMTTLPNNLPNLVNLDLDRSLITTLPEELDLPSLRHLLLSETPLTQTEEGREQALDWGRRHGVEVIF